MTATKDVDDEISVARTGTAATYSNLKARLDYIEGTTGASAAYWEVETDLIDPNGLSNSTSLNDIWGWTDPQTNREYAIVGMSNGTSFVDISNPENPSYLGRLPTQTSNSTWRDIKVYQNHAFIVSEASGHGMQVFDLTELRNISSPTTFSNTA